MQMLLSQSQSGPVIIDSNIVVSLGTIVLVGTFIVLILRYLRDTKKDTQSDTEKLIKANVKLDAICDSTTAIRVEMKGMNDQITVVREQQIIHDQNIKALWRTVDKLNGSPHDDKEE